MALWTSVLTAAALVVAVTAAEARLPRRAVFTVEGPLPTVSQPRPSEDGDDGLQQWGLEGVRPAGRPGTVQLTVRGAEVEPLRRFLRSHFRMLWLRKFPTTHLDGDVSGAPDAAGGRACDADNCYATCYLEGFDGGECFAAGPGDVQCRCSIASTPTDAVEAVTDTATGSSSK